MKSFVFLITVLISLNAIGQAGSLDTTFNETRFNHFGDGSGPEGGISVSRSILQPDGKIIVFGGLTNYNGILLNGIVRLNSDGSIDESFKASINQYSSIISGILLPNGYILVSGSFTQINDTTANRIALLKPNGSLDTTFNSGAGPNNPIWDMQLQSSGKIIIIGSFDEFDAQPVGRIARLNMDGSIDTSFNNNGANGTITNLVIKSDNKIIISGYYSTYNGIDAEQLIMLDENGFLDSGFAVTSNNSISTFKLQQDGKLVVTGISEINGVACNEIIRLLENGTIDPQFVTGSGPNSNIINLEIQPDGKIIIGGDFTEYDGVSRNQIARLNSNGSLDTTFAEGIQPNNYVSGIKFIDSNKILIGGAFTEINNHYRYSFACIKADGSLDTLFNPRTGLYANVEIITIQPDGKILAGGDFKSYNDHLTKGIVRILPDGEIDPSFNTGSGFNGTVKRLSVQTSGKIVAAGTFTTYDGFSSNKLIRLNSNGQVDSSFQIGTGPNNSIKAIKSDANGKLLVAGDFTIFNGINAPHLVRLLENGTIDPNFNMGSGPDNTVNQIIIQNDGKIIISGNFINYNGINHPNIVRLFPDGTIDQSFSPLLYPNETVFAIALDNENNFIYSTLDSWLSPKLRRTNNAGDLDNTFQTETIQSQITQITPLANGQIMVSNVSWNNSIWSSGLHRLYHDGSIDFNFAPGHCTDSIKTFAIQQDSKVIIGGSFSAYYPAGVFDDFRSDHIARINNDTPGESQLDLGFYPVNDVSCSGDGSAVAIGISGVPPYEYSWSDGNPIIDSLAYFQQPGIYTCSVTDQLNNFKSVSILINGPSQPGTIDLKANLINNSFRPGFNSIAWINAFNDGCLPVSGELNLTYDTLLEFVSSFPTPTSQNGNTLTWNFTEMTYNSDHLIPQILFNTLAQAVVGDTIYFKTAITPMIGDSDTSNNIKYYASPVINGYDPNIKSAYPLGKCETHYIEQDQLITYTVQFQNTGNSEAINIFVIDSLDNDLDLQTLKVVGKSHDMWTEILPGNVLKFHFDNIHLPDSTNNEPESHGYVIYEVKPLSTWLGHNTEIQNTADIHFDFNPPIRTNTVTHMIYHGDIPLKDYNCDAAGLNSHDEFSEMLVYPNPANELVTIHMAGNQKTYKLTLIDLQGRQIADYMLSGEQMEVSLGNLPNGIYLLTLTDNTKVVKSYRINKINQ